MANKGISNIPSYHTNRMVIRYYFYVTAILVPLKNDKLAWLDLNKALESRKLPFLSDSDRKIPCFKPLVKNDE